MDDLTEAPRAGRLNGVDGLRALAMSAVIAQHCHTLPFGWFGVWLFFVISGYVVIRSVLSSDTRDSGRWRAIFTVHRVARIVPIYYGYVLLDFAYRHLMGLDFSVPTLLSLLGFYNNFFFWLSPWGAVPAEVGHLWTISTEMQFYVVFSLLFPLLGRKSLGRLCVLLIALSPLLRLVFSLAAAHTGMDPSRIAVAVYMTSFLHFDAFGAGALLALVAQRGTLDSISGILMKASALAFVAFCVINLGVKVFVLHLTGLNIFRNIISGIAYGEYREVWLYSVVVLMFASLLALVVSQSSRWTNCLSAPVLAWLGRISYGGYVYHQAAAALTGLVLTRFLPAPDSMGAVLIGGAMLFLFVLPCTMLFASLSYRFIESPILWRVPSMPRAAEASSGDAAVLAT